MELKPKIFNFIPAQARAVSYYEQGRQVNEDVVGAVPDILVTFFNKQKRKVMNNVREINLKGIQNMNPQQALVFSHFYGRKGRAYTADSLLEKLEKNLIPEDTKTEGLEKAKKAAAKQVADACKFLLEAGVIEKSTKEGKEVKGEFIMPAYGIEDLPEEKQIKIGDKIHTSLTANSSTVFYKGDGILYIPHPLSPEYKAGQRVCVGELKSFHVNEEGFVYLVLLKGQTFDKDGKPLKRKQCAVKGSKAQIVEKKIPKTAVECVTYKKSAGLKKPELVEMPDVSKGQHVILFTNIHSPSAVHMQQIVEGLVKAKKLKNLVIINTDHQVAQCKDFKIRTAPTLVKVVDGKEVGRIEDVPAEKPNETILKMVK